MEFQTEKHGYNKQEVQNYIGELQQTIEQKNQAINLLTKELSDYKAKDNDIKQKGENISIALTAAVEKAKEIEKSSQNVYNLKIQELQVLYARWERVLEELIAKYPKLDEINNVKKLLADFKTAIKSSIKEDFRFVNVGTVITPATDPMRALLTKLNHYIDKTSGEPKSKPRIRKQLPEDMQIKQTELNKLQEKSVIIKPIFESKVSDNSDGETLLDKFLKGDATPDSAYANKITSKAGIMPDANETGFDLKEAVNPKDDLEEIMKSFDFFNYND